MKTISLSVYNRPDALRRMLESLRRNNLNGWVVFVSSDCKYGNTEKGVWESRALIQEMETWGIPVYFNTYITRLGLSLNTFLAPSLAFAAGSDFNLYLEDDLLLSPDALDLCNWYSDLITKSPNQKEVGLVLWRSKVGGFDHHERIVASNGQGGHGNGFACTRRQWEGFWRKHWFGYGPEAPGNQWDLHTDEMLRAHKLHVLSPLYPRSVQQRIDGTHGKATDDNPLTSVQIYDGPPVKEFGIV